MVNILEYTEICGFNDNEQVPDINSQDVINAILETDI